jgi:hypothetical protein
MEARRLSFLSKLKPDSISTHLSSEASGDCPQASCRVFAGSRRQSFETVRKLLHVIICKVPGLLKQLVSRFQVAG